MNGKHIDVQKDILLQMRCKGLADTVRSESKRYTERGRP